MLLEEGIIFALSRGTLASSRQMPYLNRMGHSDAKGGVDRCFMLQDFAFVCAFERQTCDGLKLCLGDADLANIEKGS